MVVGSVLRSKETDEPQKVHELVVAVLVAVAVAPPAMARRKMDTNLIIFRARRSQFAKSVA